MAYDKISGFSDEIAPEILTQFTAYFASSALPPFTTLE